jgi:exopolyphosphatase/guanosine-5'-triphosphate,3'-diphosphate pyrophosphatase
MRVAAIDIGTNTILLLIADLEADGSVSVIRDEQVIARLGKGVDANRFILPETFDKALRYLRDYQTIIDQANVDRFIACGTSFLRDSCNRDEFVGFIKDELGIEIKVLSGDQEASLTYEGAISEFVKPDIEQHFAVLDIGGGSTELSFGRENKIESRVSLDIGSVRLTERFLKTSPPSDQGLNEATRFVRSQLCTLVRYPATTTLLGVAGTLTTLAALDLKLTHYDRSRVNGHVLSQNTIESIFRGLKTKTTEEIGRYSEILPGRVDIIVAGILILLEVLKATGREEIIVSDRGLRYGIALSTEGW